MQMIFISYLNALLYILGTDANSYIQPNVIITFHEPLWQNP